MSNEKENRQKLNVYLVPEVKDYVVKSSKEMGMSQGAFLTMIIQTYRNQKDSLSIMNDFLIELRKNNNSNDDNFNNDSV